jgi:hypothetical protein
MVDQKQSGLVAAVPIGSYCSVSQLLRRHTCSSSLVLPQINTNIEHNVDWLANPCACRLVVENADMPQIAEADGFLNVTVNLH